MIVSNFSGLNLYLSGNVAWKKYIVKAFVQRLEMILTWFESQQRLVFDVIEFLILCKRPIIVVSEAYLHTNSLIQYTSAK